MNEQENIRTILKEIKKNECELVGERAIKNTIYAACSELSFDEAFKKEKGGFNLDFALTINIILQTATFIQISLKVYEFLKKKNKSITEKEFEEEVNRKIDEKKIILDKIKLSGLFVSVFKLIKNSIEIVK